MSKNDINNCGDPVLVQLFKETNEEIRNFIRQHVNPAEEASDICQEVYFRFLRAGYSTTGDGARSLLFKIAQNLILDHARREHRHTKQGYDNRVNVRIEQAYNVASDAPSPEEEVISASELDLVIKAIDALPPKRRQAFVLFRFKGIPQKEIAARMGISQRMVEKHLAEATRKLGEVLDSVLDD